VSCSVWCEPDADGTALVLAGVAWVKRLNHAVRSEKVNVVDVGSKAARRSALIEETAPTVSFSLQAPKDF
jgi:hypothetical protein